MPRGAYQRFSYRESDHAPDGAIAVLRRQEQTTPRDADKGSAGSRGTFAIKSRSRGAFAESGETGSGENERPRHKSAQPTERIQQRPDKKKLTLETSKNIRHQSPIPLQPDIISAAVDSLLRQEDTALHRRSACCILAANTAESAVRRLAETQETLRNTLQRSEYLSQRTNASVLPGAPWLEKKDAGRGTSTAFSNNGAPLNTHPSSSVLHDGVLDSSETHTETCLTDVAAECDHRTRDVSSEACGDSTWDEIGNDDQTLHDGSDFEQEHEIQRQEDEEQWERKELPEDLGSMDESTMKSELEKGIGSVDESRRVLKLESTISSLLADLKSRDEELERAWNRMYEMENREQKMTPGVEVHEGCLTLRTDRSPDAFQQHMEDSFGTLEAICSEFCNVVTSLCGELQTKHAKSILLMSGLKTMRETTMNLETTLIRKPVQKSLAVDSVDAQVSPKIRSEAETQTSPEIDEWQGQKKAVNGATKITDEAATQTSHAPDEGQGLKKAVNEVTVPDNCNLSMDDEIEVGMPVLELQEDWDREVYTRVLNWLGGSGCITPVETKRTRASTTVQREKCRIVEEDFQRQREANNDPAAALPEEREELEMMLALEVQLEQEKSKVLNLQNKLRETFVSREREQQELKRAIREATCTREELRIESECLVALRWDHWCTKEDLQKEKEGREEDRTKLLLLETRLRGAQEAILSCVSESEIVKLDSAKSMDEVRHLNMEVIDLKETLERMKSEQVMSCAELDQCKLKISEGTQNEMKLQAALEATQSELMQQRSKHTSDLKTLLAQKEEAEAKAASLTRDLCKQQEEVLQQMVKINLAQKKVDQLEEEMRRERSASSSVSFILKELETLVQNLEGFHPQLLSLFRFERERMAAIQGRERIHREQMLDAKQKVIEVEEREKMKVTTLENDIRLVEQKRRDVEARENMRAITLENDMRMARARTEELSAKLESERACAVEWKESDTASRRRALDLEKKFARLLEMHKELALRLLRQV
jgi:hypothetical protein